MTKDIRGLLPFVTAAAGAGASYYFLGKEKKDGKLVSREGMEPWAVAVGGALVGYIAGQFVSSRLKPPPSLAPVTAPRPLPSGPQDEDYMVLDDSVKALPEAMTTAPEPDTRATGADDSELLSSLGSFAGAGEAGMGSFGGTYGDLDNVEEDAIS